jgi:hypothetical protein
MSIYVPFNDLEDDYINGRWDSTAPHYREPYLDVVEEQGVAQQWYAYGFSPADSQRFVSMGMGPEEARAWGLNAALVERFRLYRFTKAEAHAWTRAGIWPDHAIHWRRCGMTPEMACSIITQSSSAETALVWTLGDAVATGPASAHALLRIGCVAGQGRPGVDAATAAPLGH